MSEPQLPQRVSSSSPLPAIAVREIPGVHEQESTLRSALQLAALLRRHWFLILGAAIASGAILMYRIRNEPRIYRVTATIRLEDKAREISNGMGRSPAPQPYWQRIDPVLTQIEVLQSQAVA